MLQAGTDSNTLSSVCSEILQFHARFHYQYYMGSNVILISKIIVSTRT